MRPKAAMPNGASPQHASYLQCERPGAYGAGLQALIDENLWQERSDFAEAFLVWSGYAYGEAADGIAAGTFSKIVCRHPMRFCTTRTIASTISSTVTIITSSPAGFRQRLRIFQAVMCRSITMIIRLPKGRSSVPLAKRSACRSRPCQQPEMDRRRDAPWLQGRVRDGGDA